MQTKLERIEVEPVRRRDDDLAVDDRTIGQPGDKRRVQLGEIAVQRPQIPALDEDVVSTAKDDRAEAVPLRFVQKLVTLGQVGRQLREHRLDRRFNRKRRLRHSPTGYREGWIYCEPESRLDVYLIDGTYELFRHYYAVPSARDPDGCEVGAVRGVLASVLGMIQSGVTTHIGVATDHVIESFRNRLWAGYKTGEGIEPDLLSQFPLLEQSLSALGIAVWAMIDFEADDALAAAAARAADDRRVDRVVICTPDKDLAQAVRGTRVVQLDRRKRAIRDEAGVIAKFGVPPASIPDYLALVGDAADGYPGLPGWGRKSAAAVLAKYGRLEAIPAEWTEWHVEATRPAGLAATLARERERAFLFRDLATLRTDIKLFDSVEELRWTGPTPAFAAIAARLDAAETQAGGGRARPVASYLTARA
jgi:5'-3' exonuclease